MSGMDFDSTKDAATFTAAAASDKPDEAFARAAFNRELAAPPGTRFIPNNVNYAMLGMIIKKVTGQPYETFCKDEALRGTVATTPRIASGLRILEAFAGWEMSATDFAHFFGFQYNPGRRQRSVTRDFFMDPPVGAFERFTFSTACGDCSYALGFMIRPISGTPGQGARYDIVQHGALSFPQTVPKQGGFFAALYGGNVIVMNYDRNIDDASRQLLETSLRLALATPEPPPPPAAPQPPASVEQQIRDLLRN
jgi:CubicO group peptidase (beta-lactamase class C family)